jgi:DNA-binding HxlR family transcriptional regulator
MSRFDPQPSEPCPIAPVVDVLFNKWTAQVLWALLHDGRLRFSELHRRMPDVTAKVLSQRLRQLERDGLLTRTAYAEVPPRVEYEATDVAVTLTPVFAALARWSNQHAHDIQAAREANTGELVA